MGSREATERLVARFVTANLSGPMTRKFRQVFHFGVQSCQHPVGVPNGAASFQGNEFRLDHTSTDDVVNQKEHEKDGCKRKDQLAAK